MPKNMPSIHARNFVRLKCHGGDHSKYSSYTLDRKPASSKQPREMKRVNPTNIFTSSSSSSKSSSSSSSRRRSSSSSSRSSSSSSRRGSSSSSSSSSSSANRYFVLHIMYQVLRQQVFVNFQSVLSQQQQQLVVVAAEAGGGVQQ